MTDSVLSLLGLAVRGGNAALGAEMAAQACRLRRARAVLVAADAGESTRRLACRLAQLGGCPAVPLPFEKNALGAALGRSSCALLAVTDAGLTAALLGALAAGDEQYRPFADAAPPPRRPSGAKKSRRAKKPAHRIP